MSDAVGVPPQLNLAELDLSHVHFVGIGGAGQSALASALLDMGHAVSGSDWKLSAATRMLAERGVTIYEGHRAENIPPDTSLVVTTAAAKSDNPELREAERRTLKIVKRAQLLGAICNAHEMCIAIAGTHGKTTTTSMIAFLLERAGLAPSYFIGGVSRNLGASGHIGSSYTGSSTGIVVVEADEYDRSFLQLTPDIAVITNIEMDHPDYYKDVEEIKEAFRQFMNNGRNGYSIIVNYDSPEIRNLEEQEIAEHYWHFYSIQESSQIADCGAKNFVLNSLGGYNFTFWEASGHFIKDGCQTAIPGLHNLSNAVAALSVIDALSWIWSPTDKLSESERKELRNNPQWLKSRALAFPRNQSLVFDALPEFTGAERRFEVKGEAAGVTVVDDYAHHPTEVKATLAGARARYPERRLIALFQPHTYSRTRGLLHDFAASFDDADALALMPIFAAREVNTDGISSEDVLQAIQEHKIAVGRPLPQERPQLISETALDAAQAVETLVGWLKPGDVLLTLGAGDIWQVGVKVLERLKTS